MSKLLVLIGAGNMVRKKTKQTHCEELKIDDLSKFLNLHNEIRETLPPGKKFLKPPDRAKLRRAMQDGIAKIIVIRNDHNKIIAGCVLWEAEKQGALTNFREYDIDATLGKSAIISSLVTHPDYRGYGLSSKLIEYAVSLAQTNSVKRIFAKANEENPHSIRSFLKNKFNKITHQKYPDEPKQSFCILRLNCE